jgi:hypothetical protein
MDREKIGNNEKASAKSLSYLQQFIYTSLPSLPVPHMENRSLNHFPIFDGGLSVG